MITWPLFIEQRMNGFLLVNDFKVVIELKMERNGFRHKEEVDILVRELMEGKGGKRVRVRLSELKDKVMIVLE